MSNGLRSSGPYANFSGHNWLLGKFANGDAEIDKTPATKAKHRETDKQKDSDKNKNNKKPAASTQSSQTFSSSHRYFTHNSQRILFNSTDIRDQYKCFLSNQILLIWVNSVRHLRLANKTPTNQSNLK